MGLFMKITSKTASSISPPVVDKDDNCPFCNDNYGRKCVVTTACQHPYHLKCITNWFNFQTKRSIAKTCPTCSNVAPVPLTYIMGREIKENNPYFEAERLWLAREGDSEQLKTLLAKNPITVDDYFKVASSNRLITLLMAAAEAGHAGVVNMLLDAGADANKADVNANGNTALHYAAWNKSSDVISTLIGPEKTSGARKRSADLALDDSQPGTSKKLKIGKDYQGSCISQDRSSVSISTRLRKRSADLALNDSQPGTSKKLKIGKDYQGSCISTRLRWKNKLKKRQLSDINKTNNNGETALHLAARYGHMEVVKELIKTEERQALLGKVDSDGQTALHLATRWGHTEVAKVLLTTKEGKATIGTPNKSGDTVLHFAARYSHTEVVKELIKTKEGQALLGKVNKKDETALHWAARGRTEVVKVLLSTKEGKALLGKVNKKGETALHTAAGLGRTEVVKVLLSTKEGKATIGKVDNDGNTVLHAAAGFGGSAEVVKVLLSTKEGKALLGKVNKKGETALHWAASRDRPEIVKVLIEELNKTEDGRATLESINKDGDTALHWAARGHTEVVKVLVEELIKTEEGRASIRTPNKDGYTCLYSATLCDHTEVVEILTEATHNSNRKSCNIL